MTAVFTAILIALSAVVGDDSSLFAADKVWVLFRDKGGEAESVLTDLKEEFPPRALARRQKAGADVGLLDAPISSEYLQAVQAVGAAVINQSRWLNGVSVIADDMVLKQLRSMECISELRRVAKADRDEIERDDLWRHEGELTVSRDYSIIPLGAYGRSFHQAEQAGVIEAHAVGFTGEGVLVGMLDTGFQLDHEAFAGLNVVGQYDFIHNDPDPSYDPRTDLRGQASHGTACLSVIVGYSPGHLVGIAPRAAAIVAKTEETGSETRVEEDYWIAGLEWLEWHGADVVSSSLTYRDWYDAADFDGRTPLISRAAQRAAELGLIICNSAGNGGPGLVTIGAPADAPGVLAVAAVDSAGRVTGFSSRGPSADGRIKPDIAALGRRVACAQPMTWNEYARWNGTSLACPIVAGVTALVIEAHPDWSPSRVVEALLETADRASCPDTAYGCGIVNAFEAINYPSIYGRVVMLEDSVLSERTIVVLSSEDLRLETSVARDGCYRFSNLPEGEYELQAWAEGRIVAIKRGLKVPPSLPVDVVIGYGL